MTQLPVSALVHRLLERQVGVPRAVIDEAAQSLLRTLDLPRRGRAVRLCLEKLVDGIGEPFVVFGIGGQEPRTTGARHADRYAREAAPSMDEGMRS